jgi:hypothetical protein
MVATGHQRPTCPPAAMALGFSDALNKQVVDGTPVGGLSALAYDRRRAAWASVVDRTGSEPAAENARPPDSWSQQVCDRPRGSNAINQF